MNDIGRLGPKTTDYRQCPACSLPFAFLGRCHPRKQDFGKTCKISVEAGTGRLPLFLHLSRSLQGKDTWSPSLITRVDYLAIVQLLTRKRLKLSPSLLRSEGNLHLHPSINQSIQPATSELFQLVCIPSVPHSLYFCFVSQ